MKTMIPQAVSRIETDLHRAITISLFTWRLAQADDVPRGTARLGWWGDTFPTVANDRIGSRLWLLAREKLTSHTQQRAVEYAREALTWLTQDGHARAVEVSAAREGLSALVLTV